MLGAFGARVALVARTHAELEQTRQLVQASGGEALVISCDLTCPRELERAICETESVLGPITALVNNAAVLDLLPFEETSPETWCRAFAVNVHAAYHATRRVYPGMLERGSGSIHNVSSAAGFKGFADETAYCASKFALEGFSRALALEAMPRGVLVTMSSPGIRTKPTSVTLAELAGLPAEGTLQWADPIVMGEAFAYLAHARHPQLAGRRYDLYRVSQLVREAGHLELDLDRVLGASSG